MPGQNGFGGRGFFTQLAVTPVPNSAVAKVENLPGVASVEESLRRSDTASTLKTTTIQTPGGRSISIPPTVNGISTGATHFTLAGGSTPTLVSGRTFQASDATSYVAMMSQTLAENNSLTVGSTFTLKGKTFTIIGLYTTDQEFANNSLVVPLATMQSVFSLSGVDSITVYAQSYEQVDALAVRLRNTLGKAYGVVTEASTYANTISALNTAQNSIKLALIVAIVTATLVIIFAVFITVRERTTEIGTLKAIGASHWQVILADEPTGNLDSRNSKRIIELLKQLSEQGKTVIVATHDRSIAKEADVRLEIEDGRIRSMGNYVAPTRSLTLAHKKKGKKK